MSEKKDIEKLVENMLKPILESNRFELVDVEYLKEAGNWFLRIYIDKEGGITIDDCELVSRSIEVDLDRQDPIKEPYILEVSSPGLSRPLKKDKDFERSIGKLIEIKLYKAIDNEKEYIGELISYTNEEVVINQENKQLTIKRKDIAMIRLAIIF